MRPTTLVINRSRYGSFVETELRPWARGWIRTSDGVREKLARSLDINLDITMGTVKQVLDGLIVPVVTMHHDQVIRYTFGPAAEGTAQTEARAWLATGAECTTSNVASLFVVYYILVQGGADVTRLFFMALANEINRPGLIFEGEIWNGYTPNDVVRWILLQPNPAEVAAELMRRAEQQPL